MIKSILPNAENAVISDKKFTEYALNPNKNADKTIAFKSALGYDLNNVDKLIYNIRNNIINFETVEKGDFGYGMTYQIIMRITGENGKTANVLTGWIKDKLSGKVRLTSS